MEIVGVVQAMTAATRGNLLGQFEEEEAVEGEAEVPVDQGRCTNDLRGTARNGEREKLILLCMILLVIQATVGLKWEETCLNEIVIPTNWYALQMSLRPRPENYRQVWSWPPRFLQHWKELTSCELDIWLALVYAFGVHHLPSALDHWHTNWLLETLQFRACMSRDRFREIKTCLHLFNDQMSLLQGELRKRSGRFSASSLKSARQFIILTVK